MSIATKTSAGTLEPHDAARVAPPAHGEPTIPEREPEPVRADEVLDNPYDNLACTD
jgi:hypothetical protein